MKINLLSAMAIACYVPIAKPIPARYTIRQKHLLKNIFFLCCLLGSLLVNGQTGPVVPPNPIATSFKLYGDIPVSYNTGVPDITIPIYTITIGDFSLPVELKYHINSLRPASCGSNVALGWSLHYGGIVSRTMYNRPDEFNAIETYGTGIGTASDYEADNVFKNYDSERDIFNYDIVGASGEFVLDNNDRAYQMSRHPVSITWTNGNFDIANAKGHLFKFGYGKTESNVVNGQSNTYSATSSWMLTQIALANNRFINYTYEDVPAYDDVRTIMQMNITDQFTFFDYGQTPWGLPQGPDICNQPTVSQSSSSEFSRHFEKNIKEIQFPNGKLVFDLTADKRRITAVSVYEGTRLIRQFEFQFPATGGSMSGMNLLRKVLVKDAGLSVVQEYGLEYYNEAVVDKSTNTDYWGFYNGVNTINSFPNGQYIAPNIAPVGEQELCLANRGNNYVTGTGGQSKLANFSACLTNALKKITYPTNGSATFQYNLNQYKNNSNQFFDGNGLRIEKITADDGMGKTTVKTYQYEAPLRNEIGLGANEFAHTTYSIGEHAYFDNTGAVDYGISTTRQITYDANVSSRIAQTLLNIQYTTVTEMIGEGSVNTGKNVYIYSYDNSHLFSGFRYSLFNVAAAVYEAPNYCLSTYKNWDNGLLYRKEVYRKDETLPFNTTTYNYVYHYDETPFQNTCIFKLSSYNPSPNNLPDHYYRDIILSQSGGFNTFLPDVYGYYNYDIVTGWLELQSEVNKEKTSAGTLTTTTEYQYNGAQTYYPSHVINYKSNGLKKVTENKYVYDFAGVEPYQSMLKKNIQETLISQKETLVNGTVSTPVSTKKINYSNWGNNIYQPSLVEEAVGADPLTSRLQFDSYDANGNVRQMHKTNDQNEAYIWGYNKAFIIAHVINAATTDVFYTSFEEGDGNSTAGDAKTGAMSKTNGFSQSLSGLSNGSYKLTWWQKSGGSWALQQSTVTVTSGTYTISIAGQVDEVRFYPEKAFMITYTYSPLLGLTAQCDAANRTTYYEYDTFSRLKLIRDMDGNILKSFDYKYRQQP